MGHLQATTLYKHKGVLQCNLPLCVLQSVLAWRLAWVETWSFNEHQNLDGADGFILHIYDNIRYKLVGRKFDSRWGISGIFRWLKPFGRTMTLRSVQLLTLITTRNTSWGVKETEAQGWQLTACMCHLSENPKSLNLVESEASVLVCNGITLPVYLLGSFQLLIHGTCNCS